MQHFMKKDQVTNQSIQAVVQGNNKFAMALYRRLQELDGNLFFSPYSISIALAMTYAGAGGKTQTQMAQALSFPTGQKTLHPVFALLAGKLGEAGKKGHVKLRIANTLWPRKGDKFLKAYLALMKKFYGVRITPVDFGEEEEARRKINSWVEEKTENKIKDLIAPGVLDAATRLVLVNAIYFKGDWASPFDPVLTSQAPFVVAPGNPVQVPMMTRKDTFRYAADDKLQVLELPYAGDDLSMLVLLPGEDDGLASLEESLELESLDKWTNALAEAEVEVSLPRFELTFPFRLDETLKTMGMTDAFSGNADFSGMDGSKELFIGAVLHKAFVNVNEQGTEAAAATAVVMQTKAMAFPTIVFRADHPFSFFIRENKTGSILFVGRVANPG
jgi:serpin B